MRQGMLATKLVGKQPRRRLTPTCSPGIGLNWRQHLDDPALRDGAVSALANDLAQLVPECREVGDLALHLGQMPTRDHVDFLARSVTLVGKTQQLAHVIQ
jgi:hypothetical protein